MSTRNLRALWACLAIAFALGLAGCGGSDDPPPALGSVTGSVVASADSAPVAAARVSVGALSTQTAADGSFTIVDVPAADRVVLKVEASGFLDGIVAVPVVADQTVRAAARLARAGTEVTIDPAAASVVSATGSVAQVALPANAIVNPATGAAPVGAVSVRVTPIDPATDPQSMPGDYTTSAGDTVESFGAINVTLKDASGAALNLKSGSTATIRIPLASRSANPPATIPLYYMDEATGKWVQEGSATLTGSGANRWYEGTVTHFTTWNADQPQVTIFVTGCVVNDTGQPVTSAIVTSVGIDYSGSATDAVDAQGNFRVGMRTGSKASIYAEGANNSNTVVATSSQTDITLPACLVIGGAAVPPTIVEQPQAFAAQAGGSAFFRVVATGTRPLAYQWRRNGGNVAGARGDVFVIAAAASADNGAVYDVVVSNVAGTVTSAGAVLTVAAPVAPAIATQPAALAVAAGAAASFVVTATGTAPLAYQWQRDGADIAGASAASYTIPVTVIADSGAVFRVRVSNAGGTVVSNGAALTVTGPVLSAPTITAQPLNAAVGVGQAATFNVAVTGSPAPAFQWRRDGSAIAGADASSYTTPPAALADNGAVFSVVVSNSQGSVTSTGASLSVSASTTEQKVQLLRLLELTYEFLAAGSLPFQATTDDGTAFINPASVCQSGTLSVTLDGTAVTPGQLAPNAGTLAGTAIACDTGGLTYSGSSSLAYALTSRSPDVGSATMTVTNMRVTGSFFDGTRTIVTFDITANGGAGLSFDESISGANTIFATTMTPQAGATIRNELSGQVTTFVSGSVSETFTEDTATSVPQRARFTYSNLTFSVAGVTYVGNGFYELGFGAVPSGSGEVILTGNGVRVGRIFVDTDGQLKVEVDGVVQPFKAAPGPAQR